VIFDLPSKNTLAKQQVKESEKDSQAEERLNLDQMDSVRRRFVLGAQPSGLVRFRFRFRPDKESDLDGLADVLLLLLLLLLLGLLLLLLAVE
jgi:hypothetical protein